MGREGLQADRDHQVGQDREVEKHVRRRDRAWQATIERCCNEGTALECRSDRRKRAGRLFAPILSLGFPVTKAPDDRGKRPQLSLEIGPRKPPYRAKIVSYCLGWLKPYENQWLAYPPDVARCFSSELAALVGYAQHRPNLGNYEGQCPSVLLKGTLPGRLAAIDALRPDQEAQVAEFVERQDWPSRRSEA